MLTGKELGCAIKTAIDLKIASGAIQSKADVAQHFGIKTPSIYDWISKGTISKDKLPSLWDYFSDVVGPAHWGLSTLKYPLPAPQRPEQRYQEYKTQSRHWVLSHSEQKLIKAYRAANRELQLAAFRVLGLTPPAE